MQTFFSAMAINLGIFGCIHSHQPNPDKMAASADFLLGLKVAGG